MSDERDEALELADFAATTLEQAYEAPEAEYKEGFIDALKLVIGFAENELDLEVRSV